MKARNPRHGSMQVWPRKRARREYPRIRSWVASPDAKPLGFAGYKAGMTQVSYIDSKKTSLTKGREVTIPVTILECPPIKIFGARAYGKTYGGFAVVAESVTATDKDLSKKITRKDKKSKLPEVDSAEGVAFVRLICYTQPKLTTIGKKKPELFEIAIGGSIEDQIAFAKENIGKEVSLADVFEPGAYVDAHAVTTGRGFQGAVKRFGISLRSHKTEKSRRTPGSLGPWNAHAHVSPRVARAGQTGYHTRTDYNKILFHIGTDPAKINPKGGIPRYGEVRNTYVLVKGSVPGPKKRLIRMNAAVRGATKTDVPELQYISVESRQG